MLPRTEQGAGGAMCTEHRDNAVVPKACVLHQPVGQMKYQGKDNLDQQLNRKEADVLPYITI